MSVMGSLLRILSGVTFPSRREGDQPVSTRLNRFTSWRRLAETVNQMKVGTNIESTC